MRNLMTPNITLAIVLLAAMAAVALRAAARRPEPRWAPGAGSAPIAVRIPGPLGRRPVPLSRCRTYFTSCTPMGAMLLARSATASTGRRNASTEPQPEPLILGLVPDQPAPGAVTDRVHKAIYCRRQAAELSQPSCLTGARAARTADAGGQIPQGAAMNAGEPATPPDLFGGPPPVRSAEVMAAPRSPWRSPVRCGRTRPAHSHADERTDQRGRRIVPAARLRSRRSIVIFGLHRSSTTPIIA